MELCRPYGDASAPFSDRLDAQEFIDFYAKKLRDDSGESVLLEKRRDLCFEDGHFFEAQAKSVDVDIDSNSKSQGSQKKRKTTDSDLSRPATPMELGAEQRN